MATTTITGMPAVDAADLDDTAVVAVDDNDGDTRKATIAQLRTALNNAAQTFANTVTVTTGGIAVTAGNLTLSDGVVTITDTVGPQLTVRYDGSNHLAISVASNGGVTLNSTGSAPGFTFSDSVSMAASTTLTTDDLQVAGDVGFFNTGAVSKATVTGSRGGNAALASLLTALAGYGLVTDNSS